MKSVQEILNLCYDPVNKRLNTDISVHAADLNAHPTSEIEDAIIDAVTTFRTYKHKSTGTVAANFGIRRLFQLEDASGNAPEDAVAIDVVWADPTHGSEDADISFKLKAAGAALAEAFRIKSDTKFIGAQGIWQLKEANVIGITNLANSAWMNLYCSNIYPEGGIVSQGDANYIGVTRNVDNNYSKFGARDNGVGYVEVARMQGAADPYFQMTLAMRLNPIATASLPGTPVEGMLVYDDTDNKLKVYNGSAWETVTSA